MILATTETEKAKAFKIREEVFVHEQNVKAEDEFDQYEDESHHFVALDEHGLPIGSARWRNTKNGIKLERFTVKKSHRNQGIGSLIVQKVMDHIASLAAPGTQLYLHAQLDALPLYMKFDFEKVGDLFEECGIMHYKMQRKL